MGKGPTLLYYFATMTISTHRNHQALKYEEQYLLLLVIGWVICFH